MTIVSPSMTLGQRVRYRGRLAIHAALGHALPLALADLDGVLAECRGSGVDTGAVRASLEAPGSWSFGKIIAVAELSDCVPVEELSPDPVECAFGDYAPGRCGWRLASVVQLPFPIAARGMQGLWPIKAEIMDIVEQAFVALSRKDLDLDRAFQVRSLLAGDVRASPERRSPSPFQKRPWRHPSQSCGRATRKYGHSAGALSRERFHQSADCARRLAASAPLRHSTPTVNVAGLAIAVLQLGATPAAATRRRYMALAG
jgi:activating signal cointegrator 1